MAFKVLDNVEVRARKTDPWRPGKLVAIEPSQFVVALDSPVQDSVFNKSPRKYAKDGVISTVRVAKNANAFAPGELIRPKS